MTGAVPAGEVEQAAQRLLLAMTTRSLRGRDHVPSMRDEQDAARDLRKALNATPSPQPVAEVERVIAQAIRTVDADFGYSFNLTRLVDGEATHTLRMAGFDPVEFEGRDEGYALIEERRNALRAAAILSALGERARKALERIVSIADHEHLLDPLRSKRIADAALSALGGRA